MKIVSINFVAEYGSTGKLAASISDYMINLGHECYILYGRKPVSNRNNAIKFCTETESKFHSLLLRMGVESEYEGCYFATLQLIRFVKSIQPDIVHLHCLNNSCVNIYKFLRFLAKSHTKTIITHHAEFYYTGSCTHAFECLEFTKNPGCVHCPRPIQSCRTRIFPNPSKQWRKMFDAFSTFPVGSLAFVAVSPWVQKRTIMSEILNRHPSFVILNGVDTSIFTRREVDKNQKEKTILHVTAGFYPDDRYGNKGGWFIKSLAEKLSQYRFIVICTESKILSPLPPNIEVIGKVADQNKLSEYYIKADLTVITSKRETFSMILAESLCCGTPVVGFEAGGPESICIEDYVKLVKYGDVNALREAVSSMLSSTFDRNKISDMARDKYNIQRMNREYSNLYHSIIRNEL